MSIVPASRLNGLDLARFIAFVGMVIVNFSIVMGVPEGANGAAASFVHAFEGRAAATFVVLAGIGFGLGAARSSVSDILGSTLRRAAFLLCIGLLNSLIFDADILHYYAFYFLFALPFLTLSNRAVWLGIVGLNIAAVALMLLLDYDTGWNWQELSYADFWTPAGFIRNLFFNGWHPVIPWLGFMLLGVYMSRLQLHCFRTQAGLIATGLLVLFCAETLSSQLTSWAATHEPELIDLLSTKPIPPMPLYSLAGSGAAMFITGMCLLIAPWLGPLMRLVTPAGRQTLTLYIAHILLGMWAIEAAGLIDSAASAETALLWSGGFVLASVVYAWLWSRIFKRGPIEMLMRKLAP